MKRVPAKFSLRPDLYEDLRAYADRKNISCSRVIEGWIIETQALDTLGRFDLGQVLVDKAAEENREVSEVLERVIMAGLTNWLPRQKG